MVRKRKKKSLILPVFLILLLLILAGTFFFINNQKVSYKTEARSSGNYFLKKIFGSKKRQSKIGQECTSVQPCAPGLECVRNPDTSGSFLAGTCQKPTCYDENGEIPIGKVLGYFGENECYPLSIVTSLDLKNYMIFNKFNQSPDFFLSKDYEEGYEYSKTDFDVILNMSLFLNISNENSENLKNKVYPYMIHLDDKDINVYCFPPPKTEDPSPFQRKTIVFGCMVDNHLLVKKIDSKERSTSNAITDNMVAKKAYLSHEMLHLLNKKSFRVIKYKDDATNSCLISDNQEDTFALYFSEKNSKTKEDVYYQKLLTIYPEYFSTMAMLVYQLKSRSLENENFSYLKGNIDLDYLLWMKEEDQKVFVEIAKKIAKSSNRGVLFNPPQTLDDLIKITNFLKLEIGTSSNLSAYTNPEILNKFPYLENYIDKSIFVFRDLIITTRDPDKISIIDGDKLVDHKPSYYCK